MQYYTINFPDTQYKSINVPENAKLTEYLTPTNSPVLFGCCNGICGTCLIEVLDIQEGTLIPPSPDEQDTLENYVEDLPNARLACQLKINANLAIRKINPNI